MTTSIWSWPEQRQKQYCDHKLEIAVKTSTSHLVIKGASDIGDLDIWDCIPNTLFCRNLQMGLISCNVTLHWARKACQGQIH